MSKKRRAFILIFGATAALGIFSAGQWLRESVEAWRTGVFPSKSKSRDVQAAYANARAIPGVLSQLPCYCGCMNNKYEHQSNLDCFKTTHAETCSICIQTAITARTMTKDGKSIEEIRRYLDNVFNFDKPL